MIQRRCTDPPAPPEGGPLQAQVLVDWRIEDTTVRPPQRPGLPDPTDDAKAWTIHHPEGS